MNNFVRSNIAELRKRFPTLITVVRSLAGVTPLVSLNGTRLAREKRLRMNDVAYLEVTQL